GIGRRDWTNERLRETVAHGVEKAFSPEQSLDNFTSNFYYHSLDVTDSESYQDLNDLVINLENHYQTGGNRLFYLAKGTEYFEIIANNLSTHGLKESLGWIRLVIEKLFGHNL